MTTPTFFLHGGPGLNAGVERAWFGDSLPVDWWDQPPTANAASPFEVLVQACIERIHELATTRVTPVKILAHSFGGQLAIALAERIPHLIESMTLLACSPSLAAAILRMGSRLSADQPDDLELLRALPPSSRIEPTLSDLMSIIGAWSAYWPVAWFGPSSAHTIGHFLSLSEAMRFDASTFAAVLAESLSHARIPKPVAFTGPVRLFVGSHDRMICPTEDEAHWRHVFPQLQYAVVNCGHMVHFEIDSLVWA